MPTPTINAANHTESTTSRARMAQATNAPTPNSAITPAPPYRPAPMPAFFPFWVSSAVASRNSSLTS